MKTKTKPKVWNGKRIADLRKVVVGRKKAAELIACLNAVLTWKVRASDKDVGEVLISDTDTTLLLPKGSGAAGGAGLGMIWRGEYDDETAYAPNDVVTVTDTPSGLENDGNNYTGVWLALSSNTGEQPIYPNPSPQYWQLISMAPRQVCVTVDSVDKDMWVDGSDYSTPA